MRPTYRASWLFVRGLARLLFGFRVQGAERIPLTGPVLLAANHKSYFDPPLIGVAIPREIHFLAKAELFRFPLFSHLIRHLNAVPIRRGGADRPALERIEALLEEGEAVLVFPEGTRAPRGAFLHPRPGIARLAQAMQVPVVPVHIEGTEAIQRALARRPRVEVRFGEPLGPGDYGAFPLEAEGYQALAEEIMERIMGLGEGDLLDKWAGEG